MTVDLLAGLVTQAPTNSGAATGAIGGILPAGGGWFRVWLSATLQTGVGTTTTFRILLYNSATNGTYADGTGLGLYFVVRRYKLVHSVITLAMRSPVSSCHPAGVLVSLPVQ